MRRFAIITLCALSFLVILPAPAHAWWDWLDEYSGPGPFTGFDVQWRLACFNDPTPRDTIRKKIEQENLTKAINTAITPALPPRGAEAGSPRAAASVFTPPTPVTDQEAEDDARTKTMRESTDPGNSVLRSLTSFKGSHQNWAAFFGAGCLGQPGKNPIGSLNVRLGYLWSIHNNLHYAESQYAKEGPRITLLQPELSFSVFVDRRNAVEIGSGMGVSTAFVHKEGVSAFSRFYWRPIILTISPVSLVRSETAKGWRAITVQSSIVIMPQQLNDTDFGAVPGTFHTGREMQAQFGFVLDLSRF